MTGGPASDGTAARGVESGLALFADCLVTGVMVALAGLPLVTAYPALVAGCAVLRDGVRDRPVGPRRYALRLRQVLRTGPAGWVVPPLVCGVLLVDAGAVAAGVPGSGALTVLLAGTASVAVVLALRVAGSWRPHATWSAVVRPAARHLLGDPGGSVLLWLAAVVAVTIAVLVPITVLLLGGALALAAVAVDTRVPPVHPRAPDVAPGTAVDTRAGPAGG
ncbi:MAG: hypothetical protein GXX79_11635 [Actinomycetales bacterium]|nr:hypothetical protein [Actinomycetales bacterium]